MDVLCSPSNVHPPQHHPPSTALAASFAADHLAPNSKKWDEHSHFPIDVLRRAAELGFGGLYTPEALGGAGLSRSDGAVIFEALAYGDGKTAATLVPAHLQPHVAAYMAWLRSCSPPATR